MMFNEEKGIEIVNTVKQNIHNILLENIIVKKNLHTLEKDYAHVLK